jgi:dinuclear metal center YbgI/SA1388 family protein
MMTCLTVSPATVREAIERKAELVVTHHPFPFRAVNRITSDNSVGSNLLQIMRAGIGVYSPHTRFDSATFGINALLIRRLGIEDATPLVELARDLEQVQGTGRIGRLAAPMPWDAFVSLVRSAFSLTNVRGVRTAREMVQSIAVACGSGGSLLSEAIDRGCDVFVTGETNFHTCVECQTQGRGLILLGHYASERFAIEHLAAYLQEHFPDLAVWASQHERDPIDEC